MTDEEKRRQETQTRTLSLKAAYGFGSAHNLRAEIEEIRNMSIAWDRGRDSFLRRGYIVELFDQQGILERFKKQHWAHGNTPQGKTSQRAFLRYKKEYEDFLARRGYVNEPDVVENLAAQEFAAESDLRDFLTSNLSIIEPGLVLYESQEKDAVEFPIDRGRIDILAVDRDSRYVVIEIKLSRGRQKTLGQILYYMAWVDKHLGNTPCRGVIVARAIPDELVLAVRRAKGVSLFQYQLSVSLEEVK